MTKIGFAELTAVLSERGRDKRHVTAVAGAPASGKSTLAEALGEALNAQDPGSAAVFPMDGFHYDDAILHARGWRSRKGAPHTYDVAGFREMLRRLRRSDEDVAVPVFDRAIETSRNAARIIPASVRHLIVEGNYLLLNAPGWRDLGPCFDTTVFLEVPLAELERRLRARWSNLSRAESLEKISGNDLPNAEQVANCSLPAEFVVQNIGGL
jgi:pantothenate kinase